MTRTEHLEQSWRNLETDVQDRLRAANVQATALAVKRRERNPDGPTIQCNHEVMQWAEASVYASVLDCVHTAMRELGLRYD